MLLILKKKSEFEKRTRAASLKGVASPLKKLYSIDDSAIYLRRQKGNYDNPICKNTMSVPTNLFATNY
jgi:hypothetical protein